MEKEVLADLINGSEYGAQISKDIIDQAKQSGLIVIEGASDDLAELWGALRDEASVYDGGTFGIKRSKKTGQLKICKPKKSKNLITAYWYPPEPDCSWLITTNLPHANFDIMEDGELFCRGIVIDIKDLPYGK